MYKKINGRILKIVGRWKIEQYIFGLNSVKMPAKSFDFKTDAIKFCATYIRFVPHTRYFYNIIRVSKVLFQKLMQWYDISIVVWKSVIFIIIQLDKKR